MKKVRMFKMFVMFAMLVLLLAGCGQTQDKKIAEVQEANAITTADVVELLEYRDLTVEKQTPSEAWMEQWPDIEIYKVNGENLLLLQVTEGLHLYQRDKLVQELDWGGGYFVTDVEDTTLLNQLMKDYVPETGFYAQNVSWEAKNVIACYVSHYDSIRPEELDWENEDVRLTWQAVAENVGELRNQVKTVFYEDINGLKMIDSAVEGDCFDLNAAVSYYQVPLEVDENTEYDIYYNVEADVAARNNALELFDGQDVKVEIRNEKVDIGATRIMSTGGTFKELFQDAKTAKVEINDRFIAGPQPQDTLEFQVVITAGDYVETFDITMDIVKNELTLGAKGAIV